MVDRTMTRRLEQGIQRALVQQLPLLGVSGLLFLHPPNGGYRTPIEAKEHNILREDIKIRGGSEGRYFAEAKPPRKRANWTSETAGSYLSEVESTFADPALSASFSCEHAALSDIADELTLPEEIRLRAAGLRAKARP